MSRYYNVPRTKYVFDPENPDGFELSRSKIGLFLECPRCFFVDIRLGVKRVPGYPFSLNNAVDELFKQEFDKHREEGTPHPLMKEYEIEAVPFSHRKIDDWRHHFTGVRTKHEETGFVIYGAPDDIWEKEGGDLAVVDYKATSKKSDLTLDADWQDSWKRQMEIYQYLLRSNDFSVSDRGYFVYANADKQADGFNDCLEFETEILVYEGSDEWIDDTLADMKETLMADKVPPSDDECDYCTFRETSQEVIDNMSPSQQKMF